MSIINNVLKVPSYGWTDSKGEFYKPTKRELFGEFFSRLNIFKSKKRTIKQIWILVYISGFLFCICQARSKSTKKRGSPPRSLFQNALDCNHETKATLLSYHPAIKHTPRNAHILFLASTIIIGCTLMISAATGFSTSTAQPSTCWEANHGPIQTFWCRHPSGRPCAASVFVAICELRRRESSFITI